MKRIAFFVALVALASCARTVSMTDDVLMDKIKGGWAGKTVGCTYGLPTEFHYRGEMIPDEVQVPWTGHEIYDDWVRNTGNDDVYMNFTFVKVMDKYGLEAPADSFAVAFANEKYSLWHANQQGRYNVLHGLMPPASGCWENNPHADDIDFQIESDFAGLMSPGMPNAASGLCDAIGHIMNYGDGWYGGVYVAALYTLAFVSDDMDYVVREALKVIPQQSRYYRCMSDVIAWHAQQPDDWKSVWQLIQDKYSENYGCPDGIMNPLNIDAVINSAYVLMGLLYGEKDFLKTMEVAMRCGQDSDCNPATAAGILGTMLGYSNIPAEFTSQVEEIENLDYAQTGYTIGDIYRISFSQAKEVIAANGGKTYDGGVKIRLQRPVPVRFEQSFEGHTPADRVYVGHLMTGDAEEIKFEGKGITVSGGMEWDYSNTSTYVLQLEVRMDGEVDRVVELPLRMHDRQDMLYHRFNLPEGEHTLTMTILNPDPAHPVWYDHWCPFK